MSVHRLRGGEWLATAGAVVLLISLLALHWYAPTGHAGWWSYPPVRPRRIYTYPTHALFTGPRTGWTAIPVLRWFVLVTVALGLALTIAQAASAGPALPVTLDLMGMVVAGVTSVLLVIRLASTGAPLRFGAVLGLLSCLAIAVGAFRALRAEHGWTPGPGREIELVDLH